MDDILDSLLALKADRLDELEALRISTENRLRSFGQVFNLNGNHSAYQKEASMLERVQELERIATRELQTHIKQHRMWPFIESVSGLGAKQAGRLLAVIGDPYIKPAVYDGDGDLVEEARPRRGPAELWQYCGHGDPARSRRRKGQQIEYNPTAKKRLWLVSKQLMMIGNNPYRDIYDNERKFKEDAVHETKCPQCKGSGDIGQPWRPGHQKAHALRYVGKMLLRDMYNFSKELHEEEAARKRRLRKRRLKAKKAQAA